MAKLEKQKAEDTLKEYAAFDSEDGGIILNGMTMWARQTLNSEIFTFKPAEWFKIWFYIISKANFSSGYLDRGDGVFTHEKISQECNVTRDQVKHCLEYMREAGMIATRKVKIGTIIKVLKYDKYQNINNYRYREEADE